MNQSHRIEEINHLIIELASGNLSASGKISEQHDEFDAIITGINMLGEELKASTVSRDYLNSIYQGVVDMLIVLNNDNIILEVNKSVCSILKFEPDELIGKPFQSLLANKRDKLTIINNILQKKGFCHDIEKQFLSKEGQQVPVSCSASLLYDNLDVKKGILYIAKDITKIKKTEEDLRNKNAEMDTFIYKAAHDLKGPVASILGITNVAPIDVKDPISLKYFSMIQECSEKLDKVLVNLREIAAIEKAKKEKVKINVEQTIVKILREYTCKIELYNIKIILDFKIEKEFYANEKMFEIIIGNLIDNAIKFRSDRQQSFIKIIACDNEAGLNIIFKDNGIGIKKKLQVKIFNMFFIAHNSKDGSGLGLYMIKTFIHAMKGFITVKSIENKGTTFEIFLPDFQKE